MNITITKEQLMFNFRHELHNLLKKYNADICIYYDGDPYDRRIDTHLEISCGEDNMYSEFIFDRYIDDSKLDNILFRNFSI